MEKKKQNTPMFSLVIRLIAGGYLLYLAYGLLSSAMGGQIIAIIAMVIFTIIGSVLLVITGKQLMLGEYQGGKADLPVDDSESDDSEEA